jgi:hypothetical protein
MKYLPSRRLVVVGVALNVLGKMPVKRTEFLEKQNDDLRCGVMPQGCFLPPRPKFIAGILQLTYLIQFLP